jgi:hypothetical protein
MTRPKKKLRRKGLRIIKENLRAFVNAGVPNLFNPNEHDVLESKIKLAKEMLTHHLLTVFWHHRKA